LRIVKILLRLSGLCLLLLLALAVAFYLRPVWFNDEHTRFALWHQGVKSNYIEAGGYRVHYFEAKPATGPGIPLLLIHGLGSRGEDWAALIPQFAASGFHVYAPDLLGYGRSDHPDIDYAISSQEKMIAAFMSAVGLPQADVAGWSMGGWVAAKLALDHPELVNRLVLYDSAGIYFGSFDTSLFTPSDTAGLARLTAMLQPDPPKLPDFAARDALRGLQSNYWVIRRTVNSMTSGRDLLDFRLHSLRKPTLIVWGGNDTLIPLTVGESMHHLIAGSSFVVAEGCGHLAPVQCAPVAMPATLNFLKSNPPWKSQERAYPGN
jgi:pimeloyl-ACP methyl ester carboxylesterase